MKSRSLGLKGQASAKGSNLEKEEAVMSDGGVREGRKGLDARTSLR